ncbi:MAG: DNA replication and repair protein RecF [Chitinivibrionia bacterium]|nr:DNA replication and repair protein RecF [Chitinivibrionia bacterium]
MLLDNIQLINFRSYRDLSVELPKEGCLFLGENGSGKTNFFEAIGVCITGKSVRSATLREMVFIEEREASVSANFTDFNSEKIIQSVGFSKNNDTCISKNGVKHKTFSSLYGRNGFVYFGVDDVKTVRGIPQEKRQFIDMTISQTNSEYLHNIIEYRNLVRQRNFVISTNFDNNLIDIYDEQISNVAIKIINERKQFFTQISPYVREVYNNISSGDLEIDLQYLPCVNCETEDEYYAIQKQNLAKDRELKYTSAGIHRDNFEFRLPLATVASHTKLMNFGSQGQCKSAAIALKVAAVEYLSKENKKIIIVIDDAFSDLDISRKQKFFEILNKNGQIFIAIHSWKELDYYPLENYFEVKHGGMKSCKK